MAVWLVRAGAHGEHEHKFLDESRVYLTWHDLDLDLGKFKDRASLAEKLGQVYAQTNKRSLGNQAGQIWVFVKEMGVGDLVITPLKSQPSIQIGQIAGDYHHNPSGPNPYFHWRDVKWNAEPVPREHFGQDLLHSFGSLLTICRVQRNDAENRLAAMQANGWKPESIAELAGIQAGQVPDKAGETNLEEIADDQIARLISAKFRGHSLTRLVEAILKAQGYTTWRSPEGADGGADILAGAGTLGFGAPRLCVEVKSESTPIDRPTVDKLLGAVTKFGAGEGLFVSWSGYRRNVKKELAQSFFRLRLWDRNDLLEALFFNYNKLDDDLKAELPLKRIWTVAAQEEDG